MRMCVCGGRYEARGGEEAAVRAALAGGGVSAPPLSAGLCVPCDVAGRCAVGRCAKFGGWPVAGPALVGLAQ